MKKEKTAFTLFQKIKFTTIILAVFCFLIVLIGEKLLRKYAPEYGPSHRAMTDFFYSQTDERLGWKIRPGFSNEYEYIDKSGERYQVSIRYDENSFKAFGDVKSSSPKVLFIGDSYTASVEVSNEKSYFNLLQDSLDIEVFAIAAGGYGTLQELLVLEDWVDRIDPDLVVLQVCNNDFVDNSPEMEKRSTYKVGERRPYLDEDGEVFYARPVSLWEVAEKKSYFAKWLQVKSTALFARLGFEPAPTAEVKITEDGLKYPPFAHAANITSAIVGKMKSRLPSHTKMLAFDADAFQPHMDIFQGIFSEHKIPFADAPALYCRTYDWNGWATPFARDGYHWSEKGHALVAWGLMHPIDSLLTDFERPDITKN